MRINELEFGALLSYTPRGYSSSALNAKDFMIALKNERFVEDQTRGKVVMSEWVAETIQRDRATLPFISFFQPNTILVPTPKSSLMKPDTLWVPARVALALARRGLGKSVLPCLTRIRSVPKAATSLPQERPTAAEHYESFRVDGILSKPEEIVLVDDVVTRGATLIGAANRLADAFPQTRIRGFAVIRTISNPSEFNKLYDPCDGVIQLLESGQTKRIP